MVIPRHSQEGAARSHYSAREGWKSCTSLDFLGHGAQYLSTRVGLRPTSPDDRPVVGSVPGWGNVWAATGHGANGLLLGPYTAALLAAELAGERATSPAGGPAGSIKWSGTAGTALPNVPHELDPARFS